MMASVTATRLTPRAGSSVALWKRLAGKERFAKAGTGEMSVLVLYCCTV